MTIAMLREKLQQVGPVVRRIIGAPDYEGYVAHATHANEVSLPLTQIGETDAPYFSMILVRRGKRR